MHDIIIISPHMDDAVFSCWGSITNASKPLVISVFAGLPPAGTNTLWDFLCHEPNSSKMILRRRLENYNALKDTTASLIYLDFLDNQYLHSKLLDMNIEKEITGYLNKNVPILFPLAISKIYRHPDHIALRKIGVKLANKGYNVVFYPDIPYMILPKHPSDKYLEELLTRSSQNIGINLEITKVVITKKELTNKYQAATKYKSQYSITNLVSFGRLSKLLKLNYELLFKIKLNT